MKENKEKYTYKPSKFFILSAISLIVLLIATEASSICYAFGYSILFLVFAFDLETQKKEIESM